MICVVKNDSVYLCEQQNIYIIVCCHYALGRITTSNPSTYGLGSTTCSYSPPVATATYTPALTPLIYMYDTFPSTVEVKAWTCNYVPCMFAREYLSRHHTQYPLVM